MEPFQHRSITLGQNQYLWEKAWMVVVVVLMMFLNKQWVTVRMRQIDVQHISRQK